MKIKNVTLDDGKTVPPEVMFGDVAASVQHMETGMNTAFGIEHRHNEAQISFVTSGRVRYTMQDGEYELGEGEAIFINCNRLHEAHPASNGVCSYLCAKFNPAVVGGDDYGLHGRFVEPIIRTSSADAVVLSFEAAAEAEAAIREISSLLESRPYGCEIRINMEICRLWLAVCSCMPEGLPSGGNASYSEKLRIDTLVDFIHRNYAEKINLDDIANAAHISKGECCRIFKRLYHMTPFQYLVLYRLNRSIELLTDTDYSIAQIAQHVGFCSSSYYTKCFRKEFDCVPHKYRQNLLAFDENIK